MEQLAVLQDQLHGTQRAKVKRSFDAWTFRQPERQRELVVEQEAERLYAVAVAKAQKQAEALEALKSQVGPQETSPAPLARRPLALRPPGAAAQGLGRKQAQLGSGRTIQAEEAHRQAVVEAKVAGEAPASLLLFALFH